MQIKHSDREFKDKVALEELKGYTTTMALIEWLLVVLVLYYLVIHREIVTNEPLVVLPVIFFTFFILTFHYVGSTKAPTEQKIILETWAMIIFISLILSVIGNPDSPIMNLYYLPVLSSSIILKRFTVALQVIYISLIYIVIGFMYHGETILSFVKINHLVEELFPLILVAYIAAMLSIEIKQAKTKLKLLSETDQLTNCLNMRAFLTALERETERASRHGHPFSVMMVDVDDLKKINDRYGHEIGNNVIKSVSDSLLETVRGSDIVARYGGDEFIILLVETDKHHAEQAAARINERIKKSTMTILGEKIHHRVSIGLATYPEDTLIIQELITKADKEMYLQKQKNKKARAEALATKVATTV